MKHLYSFQVERQVEEEVPYTRKGKNGPIESTKKVKKTLEYRVVVQKPNISDVESAEFFYGQQFNKLINSGFLTKAMLAKKMESMGGSVISEPNQKELNKLILENIEASRVIEFYGAAKNLTEAQKAELEEAKQVYVSTKKTITEYEIYIRDQFSQTADAKAEQKLIEWFVFNFSFYQEEIEGERQYFPVFKGDNYKSKRESFLELSDPDNEDNTDPAFIKHKAIFDAAYTTLIRVVTIWYNKMGDNKEAIDKTIAELFRDEDEIINDLIVSKDEESEKQKAKPKEKKK